MDKKATIDSEQDAIRLIGEIKRDIVSTQRKVFADANRELILLYFRIGKVISENQRYGSNFIKVLRVVSRLIKFATGSGKIALDP